MKKNKPVKVKSDNTDVAHLAAAAQSKLDAGYYKEAIDLYKQLLKQGDNKDWRLGLAECYLKRALSFADKGMVKEAAVLWDNYAQFAEQPYQGRALYIAWLLQINNIATIKAALNGLTAQQLDEHYPELAGLLGLLILTERPELEALLPEDSQFITHLAWVRSALTAYRNNKLEDLDQALKQLPFRSAFRDFRTLLKAALLLPESVAQAQALLAKIPDSSPYRQAAELLQATTDEGLALVDELLQCAPRQRQWVGALKKFSKKQLELLDILSRQNGHLSDKIKFNCALQFRELFGADSAKAYCRAALSDYPAGQRDFSKQFGGIDEFEQCRLKALVYERNKNFQDGDYYWQQGIAILKQQGESAAFKIALIMRHIASHQQFPEDSAKWLIRSLEYDPASRDSYLKILKYYDHDPDYADDFKTWLDKGIKAFPQDIDLLVFAIKAATANKAFKKAAQHAKTLLKIDPVNTFAKQVLFASHLAHARKLIKTKKFHLVEKEIQQAEKLTIGKRYQNQAQLMRGFLVMVAEDGKQGLQQIAQVAQKMNEGDACGYFCIVVEALLMGLSLPVSKKESPQPPKNYQLSEQELTRLVQLIQQYYSDDKNNAVVLRQALDKIKALVKQSVKQKIVSEPTLLTLSECLDSIDHFELLGHCAKIALMQWPKPIWIFYKTYAEVKGQAERCSSSNIVRLKFNYAKAHENSDERTAIRISRFIDQYYEYEEPFEKDFFDDLDEEDDPMILFDRLPDDLFGKIQKKVEEMMKKNPPERMLKLLSKNLPANMNASVLLLNPQVFYACLMRLAADELGIDTGVTFARIVEFCKVDADSKPPSFPFF